MNDVASISDEEIGTLRHDFDRLKADFREIRTDLANLTGDSVRTAKASAAEARQRIASGVKAAGAKGKESVEAVEHQLAAHPFISLTAAFAVGMVLGLALTQRGLNRCDR